MYFFKYFKDTNLKIYIKKFLIMTRNYAFFFVFIIIHKKSIICKSI